VRGEGTFSKERGERDSCEWRRGSSSTKGSWRSYTYFTSSLEGRREGDTPTRLTQIQIPREKEMYRTLPSFIRGGGGGISIRGGKTTFLKKESLWHPLVNVLQKKREEPQFKGNLCFATKKDWGAGFAAVSKEGARRRRRRFSSTTQKKRAGPRRRGKEKE